MNAIAPSAPLPVATVSEVPSTPAAAGGDQPVRPFNFSVMLGEFLAAMQQLRRSVKEAESQALLSQWELQKSSLDRQAEHIDKTYKATIASGVAEMIGGVLVGASAFVGYRRGGGMMGLEVGSQLGSQLGAGSMNFVGKMTGGALTHEANDAQMRADFARNSSEAHGRLIGTLSDEAAATRQEYLLGIRSMWQIQQDILKSIDISR